MVWHVWDMSDDCLGWHTDFRRTADRVADADGAAVRQAQWSIAGWLGDAVGGGGPSMAGTSMAIAARTDV
jgi:hypothetical protein